MTEEGRQRILDLNFHIYEEGNVYVEDINRFAEVLVYNVKDLYEKVTKGNNPETYLTFKESRHRLMKDGVFESEIYPRKEIQVKDIYYAHCKQFIALSKQQEEQLKKERINQFTKMMMEDFDEEEQLIDSKKEQGPVLKKSTK